MFAGLGREGPTQLRAVVLAGDGPTFCAGADIDWMRAAMQLDVEANEQDAMAMADMLEAIDTCPVPVIARVQGGALGGGAGLCAVADLVIAEAGAKFGFTETRLGILPAVISPFVVARIGETHARALFPGGRRFDAIRAQRIGLVHEVVEGLEALDGAVDAAVADVLASGPTAVRAAKAIIREVRGLGHGSAKWHTARVIARQRVSEEAQEGFRAFVEKRRPGWAPDPGVTTGARLEPDPASPGARRSASPAGRGAAQPDVIPALIVGGLLIGAAFAVADAPRALLIAIALAVMTVPSIIDVDGWRIRLGMAWLALEQRRRARGVPLPPRTPAGAERWLEDPRTADAGLTRASALLTAGRSGEAREILDAHPIASLEDEARVARMRAAIDGLETGTVDADRCAGGDRPARRGGPSLPRAVARLVDRLGRRPERSAVACGLRAGEPGRAGLGDPVAVPGLGGPPGAPPAGRRADRRRRRLARRSAVTSSAPPG